ncbi:MAG: glycosyltransferase [Anaerolineae bacterium]
MATTVSVIATVKNEEGAMRRLLDSLRAQIRPPDEVIIVDGGSADGTVEILRAYATRGDLPLRVLVRPGANISQGRNVAIEAARGKIIASTDAGVRLSPNWLADLIAPFEEDDPPDVVSGFFLPDPQSVFETALGATALPVLADIVPQRFLPSSRSVAFRKAAWERVGGYPEWLDYCEDLVFDFKLREAGYRFTFVPTAIAYFHPRPSLGAFARQYYRYARGDGKADLWRKRHAVRYGTYLLLVPLLLLLGFRHTPLWWALLALGAAVIFWTPYKRLIPMIATYGLADKLRAIAWVPVIRVTGDMAKMVGYPVGVWWRWRGRPRPLNSLDRGQEGW